MWPEYSWTAGSIATNDVSKSKELEASVAKLDMPTSFDILYEGNIWICDIGASSHLTNDASGAKNVRNSGSPSLGHTSEAVKAYKAIDLLGQFMAKFEGDLD